MARNIVPQPRTESVDARIERRVVVGVDGSTSSVRALLWALEFVDSYGGVVEVVTAWPLNAPVFVREVPGHFNDARWQAVKAQNQVVAEVRKLLPGDNAEVLTRIRNDGPLDALLEAAEGSVLVVVGARRRYPSDLASGATLAEALQVAAPVPVLEVSASGVVSLPWGQHAFAGIKDMSQPAAALGALA